MSEDLKEPLYYLAKHGGFKDKNNNGIPDLFQSGMQLIIQQVKVVLMVSLIITSMLLIHCN